MCARQLGVLMAVYKLKVVMLRRAIDALDAGFSLRAVAEATGIPLSTLHAAQSGKLAYLFEGDDYARSFRGKPGDIRAGRGRQAGNKTPGENS